jgi:hypothetical protein
LPGKNLIVTDEKGGTAHITIADVYQSNGVIQVVDRVVRAVTAATPPTDHSFEAPVRHDRDRWASSPLPASSSFTHCRPTCATAQLSRSASSRSAAHPHISRPDRWFSWGR